MQTELIDVVPLTYKTRHENVELKGNLRNEKISNQLSIPPILASTLFAAFEQPSHVISILNSCFCGKNSNTDLVKYAKAEPTIQI